MSRIPADWTVGSMEWLAACLLEDEGQQRKAGYGRAREQPYYMMRPTHPALAHLLVTYKEERGMERGVPMSDMERTLWEIQMLAPPVVDALCRYYGKRKAYGDRVRAAIQGDIDFADILANI